MPKLIPVIGLEIHVELKTKSKMFCSCKNDPDRAHPNTNVCEICLAHPGTLPVPNAEAIKWTVKIGRALNCEINELSKFDRKHYFYPDLPKAYQISQYDEPVAEHGFIDLQFLNGKNHRDTAHIGITRVHLEEDTSKLTHGLKNETLVDFNRAGVPLVEIVSDPSIQSSTEAKMYCQELQMIFRALHVSDADMEKGHMRCEANISLQEEGKFEIAGSAVKFSPNYTPNAKVEVKNINSFRAVEKAIEFEIKRQTALINKGEKWIQQTRGWDDPSGETILQREKETSADYRYFPEPDIPPFHPLTIAGDIHMPEMPQMTRARLHEEYGFSFTDAYLLSSDENWTQFTEGVMSDLYEWLENLPETKKDAQNIIEAKKSTLAKLAGGWITSKLMGAMSERSIDIRLLKIKPENFGELIALIYTNRINSTNAQKILVEMLESGVDMDPTHIMEAKGYGQVSDEETLSKIVDEVIKSHPNQAEQFKAGKEPILQFLKGMIMKATEGSADPVVAEKLLREKLKK
ncbi:MAG: Asp-tRNA(Asn)/Glu-tRNA(Gln) amidotransferase subunit GatB [Candidatus Magasanikbacteria bacterium]